MVAQLTHINFYAVRGGERPAGSSPACNLAHFEVPRTVSFFGGHPAEAERIARGPLCPECRARMRWIPGSAYIESRYECDCGFADTLGEFGGPGAA